jgi:dTDP-4-dehydrorhamnose 3,5-epimerase
MTRFDIVDTPLPGLKVLRRKPMGDARGFLERMFCTSDLQPLLGERQVRQINRTFTAKRGTVRGMHLQSPPHAETKLVSCLRGRVFDVAVDLRANSPTFLHWHAEELSDENFTTMFIPEGFAHGLQTLSDSCELLYLHTAAFQATAEMGLNPTDARLDIRWPLPIAELSQRDAAHPAIDSVFRGVQL